MKTFITSVLALATATTIRAMPAPMPPNIPAPSTALSQLEALTVASSSTEPGYSRSLFGIWATVSGTCNTREYVLQRDGTDVQVNSACSPTSGTWKSPYDDAVWDDKTDIQIDHMVPLKNAWDSGASGWTHEQRVAFGNDITRPQLWAVTGSVNEAKGDQSPDLWTPPLESFHCTYAESWVQVKSYYDLTVTTAEKSALESILNAC